MKLLIFLAVALCGSTQNGFSQNSDSAKHAKVLAAAPFFIISAGDKINAYFSDKPLNLETIDEFNEYVRTNAKLLKDSRVIVSGKPKTGTFDDVIKTLSKYRIKNVTKNISPN